MQPKFVRFAVTFDDDSPVAIFAFVTEGDSPTLPSGADWIRPGVWERNPTDASVAAELRKAFPGRTYTWRAIEITDIQADSLYRNAWKDQGGKIAHDMVKARVMHMDALRVQRAEKLAELDAEWMRATGQGKKAEADTAEAKRQALRDAPVTLAPALEAARTIEDLRAITLP